MLSQSALKYVRTYFSLSRYSTSHMRKSLIAGIALNKKDDAGTPHGRSTAHRGNAVNEMPVILSSLSLLRALDFPGKAFHRTACRPAEHPVLGSSQRLCYVRPTKFK